MIERIKQENLLNVQTSLDLKAGMYRGLFLRISGTAKAAQTVLISELGNIKLQIPDIDESSVQFEDLALMTDLYGGVAEAASAAAGAFRFSAWFPFNRKRDHQNAVKIVDNPKSSLQWYVDPTWLATKVASGLFEVNAIYDDGSGQERYVPVIRSQQSSAPAAGVIDVDMPLKNIEELLVYNDANLIQGKVTRDGKSVVDSTWATLHAFSDANNEVETSSALVELIAPATPALQLVQQTHLQVTSSGALTGNNLYYIFVAAQQRRLGNIKG